MSHDPFADRAADYEARPVPIQISAGVVRAIRQAVPLTPDLSVLDFGAGTGLICGALADDVRRVLAVDVSQAMLAQLAAKPALAGKVETRCQDILEQPLDESFDLAVSAMAMHHVPDTRALLGALFAHLRPGGRLALADLDTERGDFHPPDVEGVFHAGFDREALRELAAGAGFVDIGFVTALDVERDGRRYPVFLLTATRPA